MGTNPRIAQIFRWLDDGWIRPSEMTMQVGLTLVESGSAADVVELPLWVREQLIEWARAFEESRSWWLIAGGGSRDISAEGEKLLAMLKEAGLIP